MQEKSAKIKKQNKTVIADFGGLILQHATPVRLFNAFSLQSIIPT